MGPVSHVFQGSFRLPNGAHSDWTSIAQYSSPRADRSKRAESCSNGLLGWTAWAQSPPPSSRALIHRRKDRNCHLTEDPIQVRADMGESAIWIGRHFKTATPALRHDTNWRSDVFAGINFHISASSAYALRPIGRIVRRLCTCEAHRPTKRQSPIGEPSMRKMRIE